LMKRRNLEGIPKPQLPRGFAVRTYQQGDELRWARIIGRAFQTQCTANVFKREIADQEMFEPERVFFLLHEGEAIGTATAWVKPDLGRRSGYVHMVAIVPEDTGKGLGKVLTSAVLRFFKERGLRSAYLHTDDERLAAITTYLDLGFEPIIESEAVRRRWVEVFRLLKRPNLSHRYCKEE
jgi:mycothiol synthase